MTNFQTSNVGLTPLSPLMKMEEPRRASWRPIAKRAGVGLHYGWRREK